MASIRPNSLDFWGFTLGEAVDEYLVNSNTNVDRFFVHKFGKNSTTASGDVIMEPGQAYPYLTYTGTALAMRVKAGGNTADTSAGTGARTVTIQGLDENFAIASETVTLAGASASSATTTTFSRVLRVLVATTGTGRVNAGDIVIEDSGGAADYATIPAGEGQGHLGFLTVPAGFNGYLLDVSVTTSAVSGNSTVEVQGFQRSNANQTEAPFDSKRMFWDIPALSRENGLAVDRFNPPLKFGPYTDIWFDALPSSGTPAIEIEFTMLFEQVR